jgi:opacity protein-like surface antigen
MKSLIPTFALLSLATTGVALADPAGYVELGYAPLRIEDSGLSTTPGVGLVRAGYEFTRNWAAEAVLGGTLSDGRMDVMGVPVNIRLSAFGVNLKGSLHPTPKLDLYARVGVLRARLDGVASGYGSASAQDNSVAYGLGLQYAVSRQVYASLDYASYYDKGGTTIRGPSLSVGWRF